VATVPIQCDVSNGFEKHALKPASSAFAGRRRVEPIPHNYGAILRQQVLNLTTDCDAILPARQISFQQLPLTTLR
jgi:hypothetical protein